MSRIHFLQPKKIIKRLANPHPQFLNNAFLDPYHGCEFGCAYCYGIKEELIDQGEGPSPFSVGIKTSCPFSLKKELLAAGQITTENKDQTSFGLGFYSDPYQPCEEKFQLTQRCLEIFKESSTPVQIITKSELVLRDKQILSELSEAGSAIVSVSLFSLNLEWSKIFESRIVSPKKRLELIQKLRKENIVAGLILMPIFPYLTDSKKELEGIFSALRSYGGLYCVPGILSLNHIPVKNRIFKVLKEKFPDLLIRYEALYNPEGYPDLDYCQKIEKILQFCSEKYQIPTVLPVEGIKEKGTLIVQN